VVAITVRENMEGWTRGYLGFRQPLAAESARGVSLEASRRAGLAERRRYERRSLWVGATEKVLGTDARRVLGDTLEEWQVQMELDLLLGIWELMHPGTRIELAPYLS
jgi:hypothetical protein